MGCLADACAGATTEESPPSAPGAEDGDGPRDLDTLIARGLERQGAGDLRAAGALYRRAIRAAARGDRSAEAADAWHLWATVALQRGHPRCARALALRAVGLDPGQSWYHNTLGAAYAAQGATAEALRCWADALACDPANDAAHLNRGSTLMDLGDPFGALVHFRALVDLDPDDAAHHANLGGMLFDLAQDTEGLEEATAELRQATALGPEVPGAHYNLGLALQKGGDWPGALAEYARALEIAPDFAVAHTCYVGLAAKTCDWAQRDALWARTLAFLRGPDRRGEQVVSPLLVAQQPSAPADQREAARRWVAAHPGLWHHADQRTPLRGRCGRHGSTTRPLRLGYLSADFREHAVAYQIAEVLELHDRERVYVTAYDLGPEDARSATRARTRAGADAFSPLGTLSAEEAARRIAQDGTDILIDLGGFTEHCRPEIVARRPAPVQVSYLGFPMTSGAPFLDYVVTDRYLTPPAQARHWTERFAYLAGCYMPPDRHKRIATPPSREDCGLPGQGDGLVLCCFNSPLKITPQAFAIWMRVLRATPRSVLWLFVSNDWAPTQLRREAQARGVDPQRLVFTGHHPHPEYLGLLSMADLFLDTWPYGGGATANDALWAGLPVLTLAGQTYVGRMAASQLRAVGLPQLVTRTPGGYERAARDLAASPRLLRALRDDLARHRDIDLWPLFDTPRYVRTLEDAYRRMWQARVSH